MPLRLLKKIEILYYSLLKRNCMILILLDCDTVKNILQNGNFFLQYFSQTRTLNLNFILPEWTQNLILRSGTSF